MAGQEELRVLIFSGTMVILVINLVCTTSRSSMKVGDVVKFIGSFDKERIGVLVSYGEFAEGWWDILDCDGAMVVWPETQIEVINESR